MVRAVFPENKNPPLEKGGFLLKCILLFGKEQIL
jgi:hypothetical protein